MAKGKSATEEFVIGLFTCPTTESPAPLRASHPLAFMDWPVVVKPCPNCGQEHVVQYTDVQHRPVFGYE